MLSAITWEPATQPGKYGPADHLLYTPPYGTGVPGLAATPASVTSPIVP